MNVTHYLPKSHYSLQNKPGICKTSLEHTKQTWLTLLKNTLNLLYIIVIVRTKTRREGAERQS